MVELFQRTVEQDGQGYCVVASLLMRYLTIAATQAERTTWKKNKIPVEWKAWLQHLCVAVLTLDIEEDVKGSFFFCKSGSCCLLWLCIKVKIKDVDCWQRHMVTAAGLVVLPQRVSGKRRQGMASSSDWCSSCKRFKRRRKRQQCLRCFL